MVVNRSPFSMLLKVLVVRSTTQKDVCISTSAGTVLMSLRDPGDERLLLAWNGQVDSYSHRRDCSAWPGWKPRKALGPLTRFMTNIRHLFIIMSIIWLEIESRQTT